MFPITGTWMTFHDDTHYFRWNPHPIGFGILAGPYATNISPAGDQGILVEKCKVQYNSLTSNISTESCNTSYVWLGGEGGKNNSEKGSNPNNNVITIK